MLTYFNVELLGKVNICMNFQIDYLWNLMLWNHRILTQLIGYPFNIQINCITTMRSQ